MDYHGASLNTRAIVATEIHDIIPTSVGTVKDSKVHLTLCVSLRIVRQVVPHGQCISENSIVHSAVSQVHPFSTNSVLVDQAISSTKHLVTYSHRLWEQRSH